MKKFTIFSILVLTILTLPLTAFAASFNKSAGASYMVIEGTIVSIDKANNRFLIKDNDDGKTYGLSTWSVQSLNQGDHVKVTVPYPGNLVSKITK